LSSRAKRGDPGYLLKSQTGITLYKQKEPHRCRVRLTLSVGSCGTRCSLWVAGIQPCHQREDVLRLNPPFLEEEVHGQCHVRLYLSVRQVHMLIRHLFRVEEDDLCLGRKLSVEPHDLCLELLQGVIESSHSLVFLWLGCLKDLYYI